MNVVPTPTPQIANDVANAAQEFSLLNELIIFVFLVIDFVLRFLPLFLILFGGRIIIGKLCKKMAEKKGYKGYFWTGFLLGMLGFIYVIFLPDLRMQKYVAMCASKMQGLEASVSAMEKAMYPQQPAQNAQQPYNGYNNYGY